jgi:predicted dehydrogenase
VKSVFAVGGTGAMSDVENFDIHDVSIATLNFESGAIGQITSGCIAEKHGGSKVDITVKGRNWHAWTNAGEGKWESPESTETLPSDQDWSEHLGNGDKAFIAALKSGDQSHILADYRSSTQSLAISLAANESMASDEVVTVRKFV